MVKEKSEKEMFNQLCYYTIAHSNPGFIHQYAVDAFAAQTADKYTKPVTITFALIGLYLHIEKNFSGKEVQNAHVKLAKHKKIWPKFNLPETRGEIRIFNVLDTQEGPERDKAIHYWCVKVWESYKEEHRKVASLVKSELWNDKSK